MGTADSIKKATPLSDWAAKDLHERLKMLNDNNVDGALQGYDVIDPRTAMAERQSRRGADGDNALADASPEAKGMFAFNRKLENDSMLGQSWADSRVQARNSARQFFTSTGMGAEGNVVGALQGAGSLELGGANAYTNQYSAYQQRRTPFWQSLLLGGVAGASSIGAAFAGKPPG
jgi:hypothetical protein